MKNEKTFETILKECLAAYQDCHNEMPKANRNLDFRASEPVSGEQFIRIMSRCVPSGYNLFNDVIAANVVAVFGPDAKYTIAREGSVCVYVDLRDGASFAKPASTKAVDAIQITLSDNQMESLMCIDADEITIRNGVIRLWWD